MMVPAFTIQALQRDTCVVPPPKCHALKEQPPKPTNFRSTYNRGDFPIALEANGTRITWKADINKLDYQHYLPMFFEGLCETENPYKYFAQQGIHDMLTYGGSKIFPCIPQLIIPIKNALNTKNRTVMCSTLRILQHLVKSGDMIGEALVPYYRQILPVLNLFKDKNVNCGDGIDYSQMRGENLADIINETLETLERVLVTSTVIIFFKADGCLYYVSLFIQTKNGIELIIKRWIRLKVCALVEALFAFGFVMSDFKPKFLKPSETASFLDRNESLGGVDSTDFVYNRFVSQSIQTQRQKLPIFNNRNHILYLLEKYQTLVLVGETGCGKSTQIPQYMIEANWPGQIGICEPRRVAAISLANRVADETGTLVQEDTVGYAVKFDACTKNPKIKYMTEGILLREMMSDPLLKSYSAIMLDEVHERTLYTDILMGLMKKIIKKRPELRLIIASATVDAKEIYNFFNTNQKSSPHEKDTAVILSVKGRQFPVQIFYTLEPVACYVKKSVEIAVKIHTSKEAGDILIFLTGQEEVDRAVRLLKEHAQNEDKHPMVVLPMYGTLPYHEQLKVFKSVPDGCRKVVVATNVAETSITIAGIIHVIDCGFVKMRWFNSETHTDSLITVPTSRASADQRAGRAGRVRPGKVYRLYMEEFAVKLAECTPPEIIRSKLTYVVLQLKALGIGNILKFKFPSPPPIRNLRSALEILYALGAIDINGDLTKPLGYNMAEFALDPLYSKILLNSGEFGCSEEIVTIISMLQVETIFTKPSSGNFSIKARLQKRLFEVEEGDLITYLNVYNAFVNSEMSREFCHRNFINFKSMKRVVEVRNNLVKLLRNYDVPLVTCQGTAETIRKCLVTGLFPNAAYLHYSGVYKTVRGDIELYVHPDSVLYTIQQPQWVLFCEVMHTTKLYMRDLTVIESDWLLELAPHFYHKTSHRDF